MNTLLYTRYYSGCDDNSPYIFAFEILLWTLVVESNFD